MNRNLIFLLPIILLISCTNSNKEVKSQQQVTEKSLPGSAAILSALQQSADIATTEITVRKIAIYDTSKSEKFSWRNPKTWKYGDQKCIIPIEVHIKYGYDLRDLRIDDIRITDDSTAVVVHLPKPKIVDAGYNTYMDEESVVKMSTGLRYEIGHALEEEIRKKGYEAVLKEDLTPSVGQDIEQNAQKLFTAIVKSLGWKNVIVETTNK